MSLVIWKPWDHKRVSFFHQVKLRQLFNPFKPDDLHYGRSLWNASRTFRPQNLNCLWYPKCHSEKAVTALIVFPGILAAVVIFGCINQILRCLKIPQSDHRKHPGEGGGKRRVRWGWSPLEREAVNGATSCFLAVPNFGLFWWLSALEEIKIAKFKTREKKQVLRKWKVRNSIPLLLKLHSLDFLPLLRWNSVERHQQPYFANSVLD